MYTEGIKIFLRILDGESPIPRRAIVENAVRCYESPMTKKNLLTPTYVARNLSIAVGLVLIWRGIWYVLDWIDAYVFAGNYAWTSIGGILLGLVILYLPDKDLKELEKL